MNFDKSDRYQFVQKSIKTFLTVPQTCIRHSDRYKNLLYLFLFLSLEQSMQAGNPDNDASVKICKLGESHNKQVIMVCLNKSCDAKRLCCLTCIDEFHNKHELISLEKFERMLSELAEKNQSASKKEIVDLVKQQKAKVKDGLQSALNRCIHDYHNEIKKSDDLFNDIIESIQNSEASLNFLEDFYANFNSKMAQKYYSKVLKSKSNNFESVKSTLATFSKVQTMSRAFTKNFEVQFNKNLEIVNTGIVSLQKCISEGNYVIFERKFSKTNKAACLALSEDQMSTKRIDGTGGYPINLMEKPLTKENNQVKIKIIEEPGNKGIWMGIAILPIVKEKNFLGCYGIGKGTYAIDQVGANHTSAFTWNHHDASYNLQPKVGFQFLIGDVVTMSVDFDKSTITFQKGFQSYTQPIKLDLGDIYAFAGPTNLGDNLALQI